MNVNNRTLPYDQRLLRSLEEWRSLRAVPLDYKLNIESMLNLLGLDMRTLRLKFGRQALRGKEPEVDVKEHTKVDSDDEDEDEGEKIVDLEAESEDEWVGKHLTPEELARWLDDRSNDG